MSWINVICTILIYANGVMLGFVIGSRIVHKEYCKMMEDFLEKIRDILPRD